MTLLLQVTYTATDVTISLLAYWAMLDRSDQRYSGGIVVIAGGPVLPAEIDLAEPNVPII